MYVLSERVHWHPFFDQSGVALFEQDSGDVLCLNISSAAFSGLVDTQFLSVDTEHAELIKALLDKQLIVRLSEES